MVWFVLVSVDEVDVAAKDDDEGPLISDYEMTEHQQLHFKYFILIEYVN